MRKCFSCDHDNEDGSVYCVRCGTPLDPKAYSHLLAQAAKKYGPKIEPRAYGSLRFISGLFSFVGWVIIILGWFGSISLGSIISEIIGSFVRNNMEYPEFYSTQLKYLSLFITVLFGSGYTLAGVGAIASGELITLFLDIGYDVRAIRAKSQ